MGSVVRRKIIQWCVWVGKWCACVLVTGVRELVTGVCVCVCVGW